MLSCATRVSSNDSKEQLICHRIKQFTTVLGIMAPSAIKGGAGSAPLRANELALRSMFSVEGHSLTALHQCWRDLDGMPCLQRTDTILPCVLTGIR